MRCKLSPFGRITKMGDDRKFKALVFGIIKVDNKRGRLHRNRRTTWRIGAEAHHWNCSTWHRTTMDGKEDEADTGHIRAHSSW